MLKVIYYRILKEGRIGNNLNVYWLESGQQNWYILQMHKKMSSFFLYKFGGISKIFANFKSKVWDIVDGSTPFIQKYLWTFICICGIYLPKDLKETGNSDAWVRGGGS